MIRDEVETHYKKTQDTLLSLKPGINGYWQAYGRNKVVYENGE